MIAPEVGAAFVAGCVTGAVVIVSAVLLGMRLQRMQPPEIPTLFAWMERREARDDELRAQNAAMVRANRAASPHGLALIRDEYDHTDAGDKTSW